VPSVAANEIPGVFACEGLEYSGDNKVFAMQAIGLAFGDCFGSESDGLRSVKEFGVATRPAALCRRA